MESQISIKSAYGGMHVEDERIYNGITYLRYLLKLMAVVWHTKRSFGFAVISIP